MSSAALVGVSISATHFGTEIVLGLLIAVVLSALICAKGGAVHLLRLAFLGITLLTRLNPNAHAAHSQGFLDRLSRSSESALELLGSIMRIGLVRWVCH